MNNNTSSETKMNLDIKNKDGLEYLKDIENDSIDLVLTDPPYIISRETGMNKHYNNVKEAQKNAYTNTYLPLMKRVNNAVIKDLNKRQGTNYTYEVNLSKIEALKETNTIEQLIVEQLNNENLTPPT